MCVYDTEDINSERNTLCIFPSESLVAEVVFLFVNLEILLYPEMYHCERLQYVFIFIINNQSKNC